MFGKASIFAFCLGCIFISACVVPQGRYFAIEDKFFAVEDKLTETQAQLAEDKQSLAELQVRNYKLNAKIKDLEKQLENEKKKINDVGGTDSVENIKASKEIIDKINIEIGDKLREEIGSREIRVEKMEGKLKITFGNKMLFDKGSAKFHKNRGKSLLNKLAELLEERKDLNVVVEGHSDAHTLPSWAKYESNWELSAARASSVVEYLENQGIDSEGLTASGRGSSDPISPEDKFDDTNRRVEIYILPKPSVLR
jgi:chemotaxis protein MotB